MSLKSQQSAIISKTEKYIQKTFDSEGSGHDWWHIFRVNKMARKIADTEGGDLFIIEMASLLHDLDDWKLAEQGTHSRTKLWLDKMHIPKEITDKIVEIIEQVSFKGAGVETNAESVEAKIVQDADRLDAIGAIGIARTFAYGGNKGRLIYDPQIKPELHQNFEAYKKSNTPTINHFYEKLLLLKERLNTQTARKIAEKRHQFMLNYLTQFFEEWES